MLDKRCTIMWVAVTLKYCLELIRVKLHLDLHFNVHREISIVQ